VRVRGGDEFDEIYRAHRDWLFRLGVVICGDRARSEDAVAEVFAKVLARWQRGAVGEPAQYLRRALVNELTGGFRRRAIERREAARQWGDARGGPEVATEVSDHHSVRDALASLPIDQRAVVALRFYEGLSEAETAAVLGVRPGTVKSRTHRALARLRELLREENANA
jgi:RNA polymerase sigma-70 factor (sigma-E family)